MFYSHEILTSPEHGVATIWLVATLGPRSIARRLNRKAILDVDVPNACRVIIDPEAPMALRLRGSLLYGVSQVYNQQCGYALLDTQAMHDRMACMLKAAVGNGLDPTAGQTRPSTLILPYDPSFLPETSLPGLDIDLSYFAPVDDSSQLSSLWSKSPVNSLSGASQLSSLQLDLPSDDLIAEGNTVPDDARSAKKDIFGQVAGLGVEEGVLLQPDFEFDEDGNLVELGGRVVSPSRRDKSPGAGSEGLSEKQLGERLQFDEDQMMIENPVVNTFPDGEVENDMRTTEPVVQETHVLNQADELVETQPERVRRIRQPKEIISDDATALRNLTMAQWNDEYVANMTQAWKQKQQNKMPTISKKNAAFWVFGQGICSVGLGLGMQQESHPLKFFSGESLFEAAGGYQQLRRKHTRTDDDDDSEGRRVRAREEEQLSRQNIDRLNMDVEFGRDAPPSLLDDHSSFMPWNITSVKSSLRAHRFGSVSELSSQKGRSRLPSASPLAGRGYLGDPVNMDLDLGDDLDLTRYLEGELATDRGNISSISPGKRSALEHAQATLDRESLNFMEFLKSKMGLADQASSLRSDLESPVIPRLGRVTFATLMPPESVTRAVATQALVNVLTLATKGVLRVHQDQNSVKAGSGYHYGEIQLWFDGM